MADTAFFSPFFPTAADGRKHTHTHTHADAGKYTDNSHLAEQYQLILSATQRALGRVPPVWTRSADREKDGLRIHAKPRRIPRSHGEAKKKKKSRTNEHRRCTCSARKQLDMIDGERHKGQQSAGLRLDRTRLLLHHLDSGDGAEPD